MKLKVVEVVFYDVENDNGWFQFDPRKLKEIKTLKAYGILVHRDNEWVVLSFTHNPGAAD